VDGSGCGPDTPRSCHRPFREVIAFESATQGPSHFRSRLVTSSPAASRNRHKCSCLAARKSHGAPCLRFLAPCYAHLGQTERCEIDCRNAEDITPDLIPSGEHWRVRENRTYYLTDCAWPLASPLKKSKAIDGDLERNSRRRDLAKLRALKPPTRRGGE
jgi:hypothetical protein